MTAPTIKESIGDYVARRESGSIGGTFTAASDVGSSGNAALAGGLLTITPGFSPSRITVINVTDRIRWEWFAGMAAGTYVKTAANGTVTLETDGGTLAASPKFVVSSAAGVTGTAPVTYEPVSTVTLMADDTNGIVTNSDITVWEIVG